MAGNTKNPFQQQYIDSFQGKNVSDLQNLPKTTLSELRSQGYIVDGTGSPNATDIDYNPNYNNLRKAPRRGSIINNPAPEDRSLYNSPPTDPIRVTQRQTLDVPAISPGDVDVIQSESGKLQRIQVTPGRTNRSGRQDVDLTDRGSSNLSVSRDAPEENQYDDSFELVTNNYGETDDDSETGSRIGLNSDPKSKTKINQSKDATAINKGPYMEDLTKVAIDPRPNELNSFSSVTYNIALYMMNSKSFVNLLQAPKTPEDVLSFPNALLLMRSGGVGLDGKSSDFQDDFFIDDLEVINIAVGPSKIKQNTNATDIRFTITEPRGVTLLERLQNAAASVLVSSKERYIHAPYLLEIKFKGYDKLGTPVGATSQPKYIPIQITDMDFEVTGQGTQYKVSAIPYSHQVMGSIRSTIPFNIELNANTVGDIFSSVAQSVIITPEQRITAPDEGGVSEFTVPEQRKYGEKYKDLAESLTDHERKRTEEQTKVGPVQKEGKTNYNEKIVIPPAAEKYDTYKFKIAAEIAQAKLNLSGLYDALNTPAPTENSKEKKSSKGDKNQYQAYVQGLTNGVTLSKDLQTFKINAGTDITKLLNLVIMHSEYMESNVEDNPEQYAKSGQPINWFKIRPVITSATGEGQGYDNKDGRYKYEITYAVEKSNLYYNDFPWAKKSQPMGRGIHKIYNYIYSGNNTEVLQFDLKFRAAFMQAMTAATGSPFANKTANSPFAPLVKELPLSTEGNTINGADTVKRARAKDLFSSLMSDGVDMVELRMQIVGDPSYLPTSDVYWQDKLIAGETYTTAFMPDGTINYNLSPPYVQVNLKTPVDYNEISGLADPSQYGNSSFSGVYQVTQIESTFSGGLFQQRLEGFRAPLQPTPNGVARNATDIAGKERNALDQDIQSGADFEINNRVSSSNAARVVDPFDGEDGFYEDTPVTSNTVNNARTQQIARDQQDSTVITITNNNPTQSEDWARRYNAYPDGAI